MLEFIISTCGSFFVSICGLFFVVTLAIVFSGYKQGWFHGVLEAIQSIVLLNVLFVAIYSAIVLFVGFQMGVEDEKFCRQAAIALHMPTALTEGGVCQATMPDGTRRLVHRGGCLGRPGCGVYCPFD